MPDNEVKCPGCINRNCVSCVCLFCKRTETEDKNDKS